MDRKEWTLSYGPDGWKAHLQKTPLVMGILGDAYAALIKATDHKICCNLPEALWDIPLGEERYEDGKPVESVASLINDWSTRLDLFFSDQAKDRATVPVDDATAALIDPEFYSIFKD